MSLATQAIQRDVLANGMVIITEPMEHVRSASVGFWVRTGSRREPAELNGLAHFIEHMVFKGTERRSAEQIAREVDSVGGMLDAFTGKEMICFNARVLDEHLPIAYDVLADMVLRPRFDDEDIVKEKQVILEELKMDQDNPDYLVHELFTQHFWRDHPLGKPILGTKETVLGFSRKVTLENFRSWFAPNQLVLTAAGHIEHERLLELATRDFAATPAGGAGVEQVPPRAHAPILLHTKRELEQVHICLGVPSYQMADARRFGVAVLNTVLGGGMSSRLFQNIREKQGLAYAVFSELSPYRDAGMLSIYAGTSLDMAGRVLRSITDEFRIFKQETLSPEELRRAKDHLKGSLMLSLESTSARISHLARQEMYFGRFFSADELLDAIEAVTAAEVQAIAQELLQPERIGVTVLGNLDGFQVTRAQLAC